LVPKLAYAQAIEAADDRSSLDTQRRKIMAAAELAGLTLDELIEEPGVSGGKPLADRPEGGPLLARLVKGDVLIVAKLDRAFRNAADALATAERLKARKVDLIVADMGSEPVTQNGVSRMFFGMLALVAEFERERIKERSGAPQPVSWPRMGRPAGSNPLDDQVDERLGRRVGVLDPMRGIGAAAAAVTRGEFSRLVAHGDADSAGGHVHMLDRARSVGGGRPQNSGGRDLIAHEIDAAAGGCRPQTIPTGRVFTASTLAAA
jgi:hypothetical protein